MTLFIVHITFLITLFITAAFAVSKLRNVVSNYRPMLVFFIATFLFETLLFVFANSTAFYRVLMNLQVIVGFIMVCWQAKNLHIFKNLSRMKLLMGWMLVVWLVELIFRKFNENDIPWFSVVYAFITVLLAIEILKRQLVIVNQRLLENSIVLFSMGLIFYYSFIVLLDLFMIIGQYSGQSVLGVAYFIYIALGLVTNFLYLRAVLCIPKPTH